MKRFATRRWAASSGVVLLLALALAYIAFARRSPIDVAPTESSRLDTTDGIAMLFIDSAPGPHYGRISGIDALGDDERHPSDLPCSRVHTGGDRVLCLRADGGFVPRFEAAILDTQLHTQFTLALGGAPSRARLSRDGRIAAWTVFVSGDSYASGTFSTRTSIYDIDNRQLIESLESFTIDMNGARYQAADVNFWGVTITADDRSFYATMATGGRTYLVRGDLRARHVTALRDNAECPSLSPDDTRIAFKKRESALATGQTWRLYVLDLATMRETPLAESRNVDDQAAWLDDRTVAYSLPRVDTAGNDIWVTPADGSGQPRLLVPFASSPAPARIH